MKPLFKFAAALAALLAMHGALAGTLTASFVGNDAHNNVYGDSIGGSAYDISGATVTRVGNVLKVVINTAFAGNAGGNPSIGYGDLFLSNIWNPTGTGPDYLASNANTGTVWNYALHIDDALRATNGGGALSLYQLNGSTNAANIWNSDHYLATSCGSGCTYRNTQAAGVKLLNDNGSINANVAKVTTTTTNQNLWATNSAAHTLTFTMDVSGTALMSYSSFAIHWGETCQNDIIEGKTGVPEPASLALLGAGLCGFLAMRRRKKIA